MRTIFSIATPKLGGLDMLLPMFMQIKRTRPGIGIVLVFLESRPYKALTQDPFLFGEVSRVVDGMIHVNRDSNGTGLYGAIKTSVRFLPVLARMLVSPRLVLLHSRGIVSLSMKVLYGVTKLMGGRAYEHFSGLALTLGRTPDKKSEGGEGDGFLCFSANDAEYLRAMGRTRIHAMGYTRLFPAWIERVREMSGPMVAAECERLGLDPGADVAALFLGSTVPGLFDLFELEKWLESAVKTVDSALKGASILIKPHPMQDMEHLVRFLDGIGSGNVRVTHLHPCLLADRSKLVIAHHTSTIIDAMAVGTPTIQFQEFTEKWMKRHPEGSSFLRLGPLPAGSEKELEGRVAQVLAGDFTVPDIKKTLGHKENVAVVLGES